MAAYARANPGKLVMWVCEQGDVISQILCDGDIPQGFIVCDLVKNKDSGWASAVGSALCWGRPVVVAVNRAFLVSRTRYLGLAKVPLGLVIHDDLHTTFFKRTPVQAVAGSVIHHNRASIYAETPTSGRMELG